MGRSYEHHMTVPVHPDQVAHRAQQVISSLPKVTGMVADPPYIRAKVGIGLMSWGEKITVHLGPEPRGTTVHIRSECAFPLQLVDYGKNKKNVERIASGLAPNPAR